MKIRKIVIMAIRGNTELRRKLKEILGITEPTFIKYLNENNDALTKASALQVIGEETGLDQSEILEPVTDGMANVG